ncbi:hypothetical protein HD806DRAFT_450334 [Xylariaceae sp. AK1471]|nr:hypothetical protein HD806DRAFT_450334 [Xylariaceae sp. AK1471]
MCLLGHQDPTVAVGNLLSKTELPGNDGNHSHSPNQHRTASRRLSRISEHQKENSQSYEDECLASYIEAIKTPLLKPTLLSHSRRHGKGKSQSSDGSFAISPFQLDSEQIDTCWGQGIKNPVASTWLCTVSVESKDQTKPHDPSRAPSEPPSSVSPKIFEVEWQSIRWAGTQPNKVYIERHIRTLSGTGFDGPLSCMSGTSPRQSRSDVSTSALGSLTPSNCPPSKSRKIKSDTSGSIDWEKSWPKRKPRRVHNVSESSDFDSSAHTYQVDCSSIVIGNRNSAEGDNIDTPIREEQEDQQSQLPDIQECAMKSCPDFHQGPPSAIQTPPITRCSTDRACGLKSPNYSRFDTSRHQHHLRVPDTVLKRFRSLRDRLHRFRSSSMYSIRSEFPPPPDGKERRILSRNSTDIWPSSGEESPIFNTPESNTALMQPRGRRLDPLAASGLMIAIAELDRLTGSAQGNSPRTSATNLEQPNRSSGTDSPQSEGDASAIDTTPSVLANSPSSSFPPSGLPSPSSRLPQRSGRSSRRQHSRLSEVTTPDEANTPTQRDDDNDGQISPQALSLSAGTTQDPSQDFEAERRESLVPRPLSIIRPSSSDDKQMGDSSLASMSRMSRFAPIYDKAASGPAMETGILPPGQISSRGQAPGLINAVENRDTLGKFWSESCHPDTWSSDQGEPRDSEPFCPSNCSDSNRYGHESQP